MRHWHGQQVMWLAPLMIIGLMSFSPLTARAQDNPKTITIALNEYKGSGVSGWAMLTADGKGVKVQMAVEGAAITGDHPTHIHAGTCVDFDPNPKFPLTTVVLDPLSSDGVSETSVPDISLDDLLAGDYVILVHKSHMELTTYFVCGDIKTSNAIAPPAAGEAGTVSMSETGVGTTTKRGHDAGVPIGFAALTTLLAGIAFALRRRARTV